jgi:hypothetical protein
MGLGLGLYMNMKKLIICTAAVALLLTQTSCLKKQNLEDNNLGPAVDANSIQQSMSDAAGGLYLDDARVHEANALMAATTFEDAQTIKLFSQVFTIDSITASGANTAMNFNYSVTDYINPEQSFSNQRYILEYGDALAQQSRDLRPSAELRQRSASPYFLVGEYSYVANSLCRLPKVSCHNLTIVDESITLSQSMADPRICSNPTNCVVATKKIEFDLLNANSPEDDGSPQRLHYKLIVAKRLPLLSKVLQYCVRYLADMNNRKVLAEDCVTVSDFAVGD